ncbi:MAG TPA: hypothetical protein VH877_02905 [Polyangia bacterium]|nr:hypothetical protein [Polyangia bacterium]
MRRSIAFASSLLLPLACAAAAAADPIERRLHIGQAEASSYDKNDWNRFEENYLPLYVADDDPATTWTEGAPGDGAGEWIRVQVSAMKGATRVRLKIRNGYQKTHKLFLANARARKVALKLLPGGTTIERELTDSEGWQEVSLEQPAGPLSGVELKIVSTYPGKKYADLCISDLQLLVTAETPDNPAYEKSIYERVKKWRADRLAAAAAFKKAVAGRPLPIAPSYQSDRREVPSREICADVACQLARLEAPSLTPPEREAIQVLSRALADKLAGWEPVQLVVTAAPLPAVDGLCVPFFGSCSFDPCDQPQMTLDRLPLLVHDGFRVLEVKQAHSWETLTGEGFGRVKECNRDEPVTFAWARREGADKKLRALLVVRCGLLEGREGKYPDSISQFLVYDDDGHARLSASDRGATSYRWQGDEVHAQVAGGRFTGAELAGSFEPVEQVAKAR